MLLQVTGQVPSNAAAVRENEPGVGNRLLGRSGRMTEAIHGIGRGADAFEGAPYQLPLSWPIE